MAVAENPATLAARGALEIDQLGSRIEFESKSPQDKKQDAKPDCSESSPRDHGDGPASPKRELWSASDALADETDNADWLDWPAEVSA